MADKLTKLARAVEGLFAIPARKVEAFVAARGIDVNSQTPESLYRAMSGREPIGPAREYVPPVRAEGPPVTGGRDPVSFEERIAGNTTLRAGLEEIGVSTEGMTQEQVLAAAAEAFRRDVKPRKRPARKAPDPTRDPESPEYIPDVNAMGVREDAGGNMIDMAGFENRPSRQMELPLGDGPTGMVPFGVRGAGIPVGGVRGPGVPVGGAPRQTGLSVDVRLPRIGTTAGALVDSPTGLSTDVLLRRLGGPPPQYVPTAPQNIAAQFDEVFSTDIVSPGRSGPSIRTRPLVGETPISVGAGTPSPRGPESLEDLLARQAEEAAGQAGLPRMQGQIPARHVMDSMAGTVDEVVPPEAQFSTSYRARPSQVEALPENVGTAEDVMPPRVFTQQDVLGPVPRVDRTNPAQPTVADITNPRNWESPAAAVRGPEVRPKQPAKDTANRAALAAQAVALGAGGLAYMMNREGEPAYDETSAGAAEMDPLEASATPLVMEEEDARPAMPRVVTSEGPFTPPELVSVEAPDFDAEIDKAIAGQLAFTPPEAIDEDPALEAAAAPITPDPPVRQTVPALRTRPALMSSLVDIARREGLSPQQVAELYPEKFGSLLAGPGASANMQAAENRMAKRARQDEIRDAIRLFGGFSYPNSYTQAARMAHEYLAMSPENRQAILLERNTAPDVEMAWDPRRGFVQKVSRRGAAPADAAVRQADAALRLQLADKEAGARVDVANIQADADMGVAGLQAQGADADRAARERMGDAEIQGRLAVADKEIEKARVAADAAAAAGNRALEQDRLQHAEKLEVLRNQLQAQLGANEIARAKVDAERPQDPAALARGVKDAEAAALEREAEATARDLRARRYTRERALGVLRRNQQYRLLRPEEMGKILDAAGFPRG